MLQQSSSHPSVIVDDANATQTSVATTTGGGRCNKRSGSRSSRRIGCRCKRIKNGTAKHKQPKDVVEVTETNFDSQGNDVVEQDEVVVEEGVVLGEKHLPQPPYPPTVIYMVHIWTRRISRALGQ